MRNLNRSNVLRDVCHNSVMLWNYLILGMYEAVDRVDIMQLIFKWAMLE